MAKIKYDPELSVKEIARISGVKEPTVWKYIRENFIDRRYDTQLIRFRRVQQYRKENSVKKLTPEYVARALGKGYSRNTVKKYFDPNNPPVPDKNKFLSTVDITMSKACVASVSDEDRIILGIILRFNLGDDRFDCDLTFSKGDFYKYGLLYPRHCFDLYPNSPDVKSLKEGETMLLDNSLASVIIDLPQEISEDGTASPNAFMDLKHMALSYYRMLSLAYKKLRYHSGAHTGGLLIVKVGDIRWKGKMIWMSKIVTELATGRLTRLSDPVYNELRAEAERRGSTVEAEFPLFDMELTDKYVHTYDPDSLDASQSGSHSVKAHDYFLVFRKGLVDYDTFYFASDFELADNKLPGYPIAESVFGVKVVSRKYCAEGRYIYEVRLPQKNKENHINIAGIVSDEIRRKLSNHLGFTIPFDACRSGANFLSYLKEVMYRRLIEMSNPEVDKRTLPTNDDIEDAIAKCLHDCGIQYIQWPQGNNWDPRDCYRTILDESIVELKPI